MKKSGVTYFVDCSMTPASIGTLAAQRTLPAATGAAAPATAQRSGVDVLRAAWVRPDGGYTIAIKSIGANGALDAMHLNPNRRPFAKAQATQEGGAPRVFLELQAGGHAGSAYDRAYDPASDLPRGVCYQAVARKWFEVCFARK
jgi:uncharacterized protein (DUF2147 family)